MFRALAKQYRFFLKEGTHNWIPAAQNYIISGKQLAQLNNLLITHMIVPELVLYQHVQI